MFTTYNQNLQVLATEMFKIRKGISTPKMNDNSEKRDPSYSLTDNDNFHFPSVNKAFNDLDGISFLGPKT